MNLNKCILEWLDHAGRIAQAEGYPVAEYQVETLRILCQFDDLAVADGLTKSLETRKAKAAHRDAGIIAIARAFKARRKKWPTIGELEAEYARCEIPAPARRTLQRALSALKDEDK